MSRDMLYGDFSAEHIFPQPHYGFLRVPDTTVSRKYEAVNRLGADFTQIYFPAQKFESIARNYKNGVFDPWDRPSRMAPFLHLLCSRTICKLTYGWASLLHMLIQIGVF